MITLLDVNVLIALCDARHEFHHRAAAWFGANATAGWASCPLTQNGAVRIMSAPGYPNTRTPGEVVKQLQPLFANPAHEFWPDDIGITDASKFNHAQLIGHRQITDAYLLALAVKNKGRLLTDDRGISPTLVIGAKKDNVIALR